MPSLEDNSGLLTIVRFAVRHAGELCKIYVLLFSAFGALYVTGLGLLVSFIPAAALAVALLLSLIFFGRKTLSAVAGISVAGLLLVYGVMGDGSACLPGIAPLLISIGFVTQLMPTRQISILSLAGREEP